MSVHDPLPSSQRKLELTRERVESCYHLPLASAAVELNVSVTWLKNTCRKLGITKWPYRQVNIWPFHPHSPKRHRLLSCRQMKASQDQIGVPWVKFEGVMSMEPQRQPPALRTASSSTQDVDENRDQLAAFRDAKLFLGMDLHTTVPEQTRLTPTNWLSEICGHPLKTSQPSLAEPIASIQEFEMISVVFCVIGCPPIPVQADMDDNIYQIVRESIQIPGAKPPWFCISLTFFLQRG